MATHLFALPLVRLSILERESTGPLVCTRLPADPAIAASEENAPQRHYGKETGTQCAQTESHDACLGPHGVAVECVDSVEHGGYSERREGVRCFGVFGLGCCACMVLD